MLLLVRTRGANGRIRRSRYGHAKFLQRQAEEEQQAVPANEEHVVQQSWHGGPM
ncbi:hypothetical protein A2U01_0019957 [Trifolium medium]|uniref:Uncharacterized protein n=1 Tax=Trifolium medium TaxID=97028 RepID=A0A392NIL5_9FABA|nr:hypothetical protein [Trifolium medium]